MQRYFYSSRLAGLGQDGTTPVDPQTGTAPVAPAIAPVAVAAPSSMFTSLQAKLMTPVGLVALAGLGWWLMNKKKSPVAALRRLFR